MVKSMTGYGRGRVLADGLDITFEIKSVNNRYMDLNIRMPRAFAPLEERVKALVGAAVCVAAQILGLKPGKDIP